MGLSRSTTMTMIACAGFVLASIACADPVPVQPTGATTSTAFSIDLAGSGGGGQGDPCGSSKDCPPGQKTISDRKQETLRMLNMQQIISNSCYHTCIERNNDWMNAAAAYCTAHFAGSGTAYELCRQAALEQYKQHDEGCSQLRHFLANVDRGELQKFCFEQYNCKCVDCPLVERLCPGGSWAPFQYP